MKLLQKTRTGRTLDYFLLITGRRKLAVLVTLIVTPLGIFFGETLVGYYVGQLFQDIAQFKPGDSTEGLYEAAWLIVGLYVVQIIFFRINDYTFIWRQALSLRDMEQYIFKKLPAHSYKFFADNHGGALVSQVTRFLKAYEDFEDTTFFEYLTAFSRIALSTGILLVIAPPLGWLLLAWTPIFILVLVVMITKKSPITRQASAADSRVTAFLSDAITNIITIKTFARTGVESSGFEKVSQNRFKKRLRSWRFSAYIRDFRWLLILVFFASFLMLSVSMVVNGTVSAGVLVAAQIYVFIILSNLLSFHQIIERTEQYLADAAELTDVLDQQPDLQDPVRPEVAQIKQGKVELRAVNFKYPGKDEALFDNLNLTIPAGQKVGLVGHSGSGKSTITRLLLRFIDVDGGSITIDGQDIRHITQDDLRHNIAFVPQEPLLFHRTIKENIAYGRLNASDSDIKTAAQHAYADEFIEQMPQKYETLVGERGVKLSGGERQRIAIARAMLTTCPLLILDEATSALDSKSEKLITKALDDLMKDRTTIVIAHRLSTIKKLDRVVVLKDGKIIEDGTHEELIKLKGEYAELWSHQSGNFLEP